MAKGDNISCESDNVTFQHNNNFHESDNPPTEHDKNGLLKYTISKGHFFNIYSFYGYYSIN